jgi:tRNA(fMet)-specific endonuclease VapC
VENQVILLDTSILIEYFRKKNKNSTVLFKLQSDYHLFAVSSITLFEIYSGAKNLQLEFWDNFFKDINIIPLDNNIAMLSAKVDMQLKLTNKRIDKADLFIAATAIYNDYPFATLNKKHFERIGDLQLID